MKLSFRCYITFFYVVLNYIYAYHFVNRIISFGPRNDKLATHNHNLFTRIHIKQCYNKLFCSNNINKDADVTYLKKDFQILSDNSNHLTYKKFLQWDEIQSLLQDDLISINELETIWKKNTNNDINNMIDFNIFLQINNELDNLFEDETSEESNQMDNKVLETSLNIKPSYNIDNNQIMNDIDEYGTIIDITNDDADDVESSSNNIIIEDLDVWDINLNSSDLFESDFLTYLKTFFDEFSISSKNSNNILLAFDSFLNWVDVRDMLDEGNVDMSCLKELWSEALCFKNCAKEFSFITSTEYQNPEYMIDFDTFVRMNFRLEEIIEDIKVALENLSDQDVEEYYRSEFTLLTNNNRLLSYQKLKQWSLLEEMVLNNEITEEQVLSIWNALIKEPIRKDHINKSGKGFAPNNISNDVSNNNTNTSNDMIEEGITIESFIMFNNAIEDSLSILNTSYGEK